MPYTANKRIHNLNKYTQMHSAILTDVHLKYIAKVKAQLDAYPNDVTTYVLQCISMDPECQRIALYEDLSAATGVLKKTAKRDAGDMETPFDLEDILCKSDPSDPFERWTPVGGSSMPLGLSHRIVRNITTSIRSMERESKCIESITDATIEEGNMEIDAYFA